MTRKTRLIGTILAGGPGSRLYPLTKVINKHLLPVGAYPMVYHPIFDLVKLGVKDIVIVTGHEHAGEFAEQLGNGEEFGVRISYLVQTEPNGIAGALRLVMDRLDTYKNIYGTFGAGANNNVSRLIVALGDNIYNHDTLTRLVNMAISKNSSVDLFIKTVRNNQRFGVPEINSFNELVHVEEKPKRPLNNYAVTGLYIFKIDGTFNRLYKCIQDGEFKKSKRGEYEITDILNWYAMISESGFGDRIQCHKLGNCFWTDAGTFESYYKANKYMKNWRFWADLGEKK